MKCPSCGAAELIHDTRDLPTRTKAKPQLSPLSRVIFAPSAAKLFWTPSRATVQRVDWHVPKANQRCFVDPSYITTVRKKLDLDQRKLLKSLAAG